MLARPPEESHTKSRFPEWHFKRTPTQSCPGLRGSENPGESLTVSRAESDGAFGPRRVPKTTLFVEPRDSRLGTRDNAG